MRIIDIGYEIKLYDGGNEEVRLIGRYTDPRDAWDRFEEYVACNDEPSGYKVVMKDCERIVDDGATVRDTSDISLMYWYR